MQNHKRLYRSRINRQIGGVCGGIAEYFNLDPTIIRLIFALGFLPLGTTPFWIYLILWLVIPEAPL